jgi:hypothetical protein
MSDRVAELEAKVAELSETLGKVETRLALIERGLNPAAARRVRVAAAAAAGRAADADATATLLRRDAASVAATVSLAGRTLLILAGAFLLRAITDGGYIPTWVGVGTAFAYAGVWMALADRAAGQGQRATAGFYGAAAVAIAFPLLVEVAARFRIVSTWVAVLLLSAFTATALASAARRRFHALAWMVVVAALPSAFALMLAQGRVAPPLVFLVVLGVGTVWIGYVLDWHGLRWPVAAAVDLSVLLLAFEAVRPGAADGPLTAVLVQFAVIAAYLGSTAVRTLGLRRSVVVFEAVQAGAVLLAGLGGAAFVTARAAGGAALALGALSVAFGAAAYAVAFAFADRARTPANFGFYTSAGAAFVLAGATFLLPADARALLFAGLAVAAAAGARRASGAILAGHAALYAAAAALSGGVLAHAADAGFASPREVWAPATASGALATAAAAAAAWLLGASPAAKPVGRIPRVALAAVVAGAAAGLVVGLAVPPVAGAPPGADPGVVATLRTAVLALGALALAAAGRTARFAEARWLAWPVLAVAGVKMVVEDLPRSRPATLFLALALYGGALILVPRLRRRGEKLAAPSAS